MEFSSRVGQARQQQPTTHAGAPVTASQGNGGTHNNSSKKVIGGPRWFRITIVTLVACIAVLAIAIAFSFYVNGSGESHYVATNDYQAIFLNNGQVYFGKVKTLNEHYLDLTNIFYLSSQSAQPSSTSKSSSANKFSLVKLGCELHGPQDQMIINNGQITFWENLRGNGQVAQAISKWYQQNPNGLNCNSTSS